MTQQQLSVITNLHLNVVDKELLAYREKVGLQTERRERHFKIRTLMAAWGFQNLLEQKFKINATLLPIKSVGVQGDCRSYSYVAALSTEEYPIPWNQLYLYARVIPKLLHNINRF